MRYKSLITCVSLLVAAVAAEADASIDFLDIDQHNVLFNAQNTSFTWTLDITAAGIEGDNFTIAGYPAGNGNWVDAGGFVPGTHTVLSAYVSVWVKDDEDDAPAEMFRLNIEDFASGNQSATLNFFQVTATAQIIASINTDGTLSLEMLRQVGDFVLEYSALEVTAERVDEHVVPEPASVVIWSLLGGLGVAVGRRRRRRARLQHEPTGTFCRT